MRSSAEASVQSEWRAILCMHSLKIRNTCRRISGLMFLKNSNQPPVEERCSMNIRTVVIVQLSWKQKSQVWRSRCSWSGLHPPDSVSFSRKKNNPFSDLRLPTVSHNFGRFKTTDRGLSEMTLCGRSESAGK